MGDGLEAVLRWHGIYGFNGSQVACRCSHREWRYVLDWHAHVAAAVLAWIEERLGSEDVIAAAKAAAKTQAMDRFASDYLADDAREWLAGFAARAALNAVTAALRDQP